MNFKKEIVSSVIKLYGYFHADDPYTPGKLICETCYAKLPKSSE